MEKINIKKIGLILLCAILVTISLRVILQNYKQKLIQSPTIDNTIKKTISITIKTPNTTINLSIQSGLSLYKILSNAKNNSLIMFSGKEYSGLGFFVETIGELKNGDGKNLMYNINGNEAEVGISSYIPKDGDIIEWELK